MVIYSDNNVVIRKTAILVKFSMGVDFSPSFISYYPSIMGVIGYYRRLLRGGVVYKWGA
jgi:hypothetical protein